MRELITTLPQGTLEYTDETAQPSTNYFYYAVTLDQCGNSAAEARSNVVTTPDNRYGVLVDNLTITDTLMHNPSAMWLMDELSGNIVDEYNNITLTPLGGEIYNVPIGSPYDPGILFTAAGQGFYKRSSTPVLEPGFSNFMIRTVELVYSPNNENNHISYCTGIRNAGVTGFQFSWIGNASLKNRLFYLYDTDGNYTTVLWDSPGVTLAYNTVALFVYEVWVDRTAGTAELIINNVSYGKQDISLVTGYIGSTGVGIGQDYREGISRDTRGAICHVEQTHYSGNVQPLYPQGLYNIDSILISDSVNKSIVPA